MSDRTQQVNNLLIKENKTLTWSNCYTPAKRFGVYRNQLVRLSIWTRFMFFNAWISPEILYLHIHHRDRWPSIFYIDHHFTCSHLHLNLISLKFKSSEEMTVNWLTTCKWIGTATHLSTVPAESICSLINTIYWHYIGNAGVKILCIGW